MCKWLYMYMHTYVYKHIKLKHFSTNWTILLTSLSSHPRFEASISRSCASICCRRTSICWRKSFSRSTISERKQKFMRVTLPETNSKRTLQIGRDPKGKDRIPSIHFSGAFAVSFREGKTCGDVRRLSDFSLGIKPPYSRWLPSPQLGSFHYQWSLHELLCQWDFQGPPRTWYPEAPILFPYEKTLQFSNPQRYGNGMWIVWEAYHKGVPLLGVLGITFDYSSDFCS